MTDNVHTTISAFGALSVHLCCGLGIALAYLVALHVYATNLVSDPARTLLLIWVVETPLVILLHSLFRQNPSHCSYIRAVFRGLLGIPLGALVFVLLAISLGAPAGIEHSMKTIHWSLMMSLFAVAPAACVFGSSWPDWQRIFANTRPVSTIDYMLCLPAHGAAIGSWFGAWPVPLDWEKPWQEWPICITYGGVAGYLLGMIASLGFIFFQTSKQHSKKE